MKPTIILVSWILFTNISYSQFQNEEFDHWILIDTLGQSYQDLINWETNNVNLGNGFATAPNFKIIEDNDTGVSVTSSHQGIDGLSSGKVSQSINSLNLLSISYLSKCDSIYDFGACVVNVYDYTDNLVYTDSIKQVESNYTTKVIDINELELNNSEKLTVEFVAFGQLGEFEDFQAYSEFKILGVTSDYLTKTTDEPINNTVEVFPNPFGEYFSIKCKSTEPVKYEIIDIYGKIVKAGTGHNISANELAPGQYLLRIIEGEEIAIKQIIKQ